MSISFTIPAGTYSGRTVSETTVNLDRGFQESTELKIHYSNIADFPRQEIAIDGINPATRKVSFSIKVLNESDLLDITKYFESLKGTSAITITYPDASTRTVVIESFNVSYMNSLYSGITASGEQVY